MRLRRMSAPRRLTNRAAPARLSFLSRASTDIRSYREPEETSGAKSASSGPRLPVEERQHDRSFMSIHTWHARSPWLRCRSSTPTRAARALGLLGIPQPPTSNSTGTSSAQHTPGVSWLPPTRRHRANGNTARGRAAHVGVHRIPSVGAVKSVPERARRPLGGCDLHRSRGICPVSAHDRRRPGLMLRVRTVNSP